MLEKYIIQAKFFFHEDLSNFFLSLPHPMKWFFQEFSTHFLTQTEIYDTIHETTPDRTSPSKNNVDPQATDPPVSRVSLRTRSKASA